MQYVNNFDTDAIYSLETMLNNTTNHGYAIVVTPTTQFHPWVRCSRHLFLWYAVGVVRLWHVVFPIMEVAWASRFSDAQTPVQRGWECCNCGKPTLGIENLSLLNWNHATSSANTSCLRDRYLYSLSICWVLPASPTQFSSCCHLDNMWCRQGKTETHTPHCWWSGIPSSIPCKWT